MADKKTVADSLKRKKDEVDVYAPTPIFPITRVKNIIKSDPDVKIIRSDAVVLVAKATELFVDYLAKEAHLFTKESKRKTIQYDDVAKAIQVNELAFLEDQIPTKDTPKKTKKLVAPPPQKKRKVEEVVEEESGSEEEESGSEESGSEESGSESESEE
mmetsp:Transcript_22855/g.35563  ORF Transcript_22855/g.35563 Transcript_22855/m.35563 type:complete len:158 (-) Transcript_22855:112-585(-)